MGTLVDALPTQSRFGGAGESCHISAVSGSPDVGYHARDQIDLRVRSTVVKALVLLSREGRGGLGHLNSYLLVKNFKRQLAESEQTLDDSKARANQKL